MTRSALVRFAFRTTVPVLLGYSTTGLAALVVPGLAAALLQAWKGTALHPVAGATLPHMAMARPG